MVRWRLSLPISKLRLYAWVMMLTKYSLLILVLTSGCGGTTATSGTLGGSGSTLQVGGNSSVGGASSASLGGQTSLIATGGNPGVGGQGGSSAGGAFADLCTSASDCALADGCCTCTAYAKGQGVAQCALACTQTACAKLGVSASDVTCVAGRCVLGKSCDSREVLCNMAPPACPVGQAPIVEGSCYGTSCIAVDQCTAVTSCSECAAAGLACVTDQINSVLGDEYHCISIPENCAQNPTCQCLGACEPTYQCASPDSTDLICQCPDC